MNNESESKTFLKDLIFQCWHQNPGCRPSCPKILTILNRLSFPDNWKALLGESSSRRQFRTNISDKQISDKYVVEHFNADLDEEEDEDDQPRRPLTYRRSLSVPLVRTPPPPPPLPPPTSAMAKSVSHLPVRRSKPEMVKSEKQFPITCEDICQQRQRLRRRDVENDNYVDERQKTSIDDLTSVMKRVMNKRRQDSGWIFADETTSNSSDGQSRSSSRISTNFRLKIVDGD